MPIGALGTEKNAWATDCPRVGHQSINGNLRATNTRYPLYGPPGTDTLWTGHQCQILLSGASPVSAPVESRQYHRLYHINFVNSP